MRGYFFTLNNLVSNRVYLSYLNLVLNKISYGTCCYQMLTLKLSKNIIHVAFWGTKFQIIKNFNQLLHHKKRSKKQVNNAYLYELGELLLSWGYAWCKGHTRVFLYQLTRKSLKKSVNLSMGYIYGVYSINTPDYTLGIPQGYLRGYPSTTCTFPCNIYINPPVIPIGILYTCFSILSRVIL